MAPNRQRAGRRVFVPNDSFVTSIDGVDVTFVRDRTRVREGHPVLARHPDLFDEIRVDYEWEQATDAPGDQR